MKRVIIWICNLLLLKFTFPVLKLLTTGTTTKCSWEIENLYFQYDGSSVVSGWPSTPGGGGGEAGTTGATANTNGGTGGGSGGSGSGTGSASAGANSDPVTSMYRDVFQEALRIFTWSNFHKMFDGPLIEHLVLFRESLHQAQKIQSPHLWGNFQNKKSKQVIVRVHNYPSHRSPFESFY